MSLYLEDLHVGRVIEGGAIRDVLAPGFGPERFAEICAPAGRRGNFICRPECPPSEFVELAAFCCTTAASENSPASLRTDGLTIDGRPDLGMTVTSRVTGRSFKSLDASTAVVQVRSEVHGPGAEAPVVSWTRQFIVPKRDPSWRPEETQLDTRVRPAPIDWSRSWLPSDDELFAAAGETGLWAEDLAASRTIDSSRPLELHAAAVVELTRGFGNKATVHYRKEAGYIVWGRLTHVFGFHLFGEELQRSHLLGYVEATHENPVLLTAAVLAEEKRWPRGELGDHLTATLTAGEHTALPGRRVELVPLTMTITSHVPALGRDEYESRSYPRVVQAIDRDEDRVVIGKCTFMVAALKRGPAAR
jgi:hypothetical protein